MRPLFGHNAASANYSRSLPGSIPLRPSRKVFASTRSWHHGADPEAGDFQNLKDSSGSGHDEAAANDEAAERISDGESSQIKLWAHYEGRIVKTTDVRVVRSNTPMKDVGTAVALGESMPDKAYETTEL